jgi:hypothetical protein
MRLYLFLSGVQELALAFLASAHLRAGYTLILSISKRERNLISVFSVSMENERRA